MRIVWWDAEGMEHQETFMLDTLIGRGRGMERMAQMLKHGIRFSVDYCQCAELPQHAFA